MSLYAAVGAVVGVFLVVWVVALLLKGQTQTEKWAAEFGAKLMEREKSVDKSVAPE